MSLVDLALLAYPEPVRDTRGEEMRGTLAEAGGGVREYASLVRHGLQARASGGPRRVIADGVCLAAAWEMTLDLSTLVCQRLRGMQDPLLARPSIVLLGIALALVLVGYDRAGGIAALVWTAARTPALLGDHDALIVALSSLLPVACLVVLVVAPRRRKPDWRRLAWFIVPAVLVLALAPPPWDQSALLKLVILVIAALVVLAALVSLPFDPRLAIAGAIPLSGLGFGVSDLGLNVAIAVLIVAAPMAVTFARQRVLYES